MSSHHLNEGFHFNRMWSWIGIIVVSSLSIPLHFIYEWSGQLTIVGMFAPINESIWEHQNLVFWPLLILWGVGYLLFHRKKNLSLTPWLVAMGASILISMLFIISWYYVLNGAFELETSLTNVASIFIAVPLGQLIGIHIYRVIQPRPIYRILVILFLIIVGALFIYFTFNAPDLPLFIPAT